MTKEEKAEYQRRWQKNNKEKIVIYHKRYYEKYKEEIARRSREEYPSKKEKLLEYQREYRKNNKEKISEKKKEYRIRNKQRIKESKKRYSQTTKGRECRHANQQKRRALKAEVKYENLNTAEIFKRDGYICQHCGKKTRPDYKNTHHPLYPNLDHILPLSRGGEHSKLNTQCLCHRCNLVKGTNESNEQIRLFG